ncbi:hypothetical protein HKX48_003442 [Thoreauomyces humboldtii]|nr:hypothetical protein HKX48_003442 [Thoreauomyces humboldtii]
MSLSLPLLLLLLLLLLLAPAPTSAFNLFDFLKDDSGQQQNQNQQQQNSNQQFTTANVTPNTRPKNSFPSTPRSIPLWAPAARSRGTAASRSVPVPSVIVHGASVPSIVIGAPTTIVRSSRFPVLDRATGSTVGTSVPVSLPVAIVGVSPDHVPVSADPLPAPAPVVVVVGPSPESNVPDGRSAPPPGRLGFRKLDADAESIDPTSVHGCDGVLCALTGVEGDEGGSRVEWSVDERVLVGDCGHEEVRHAAKVGEDLGEMGRGQVF